MAVRRPGRWGHPDPKAAIEVITESGPPPALCRPGRSPSASACEPYRELVEAGVAQGRDAMSMWQDLVDDHGFAHGYQSVRRFVVTLRGEHPLEAHRGRHSVYKGPDLGGQDGSPGRNNRSDSSGSSRSWRSSQNSLLWIGTVSQSRWRLRSVTASPMEEARRFVCPLLRRE